MCVLFGMFLRYLSFTHGIQLCGRYYHYSHFTEGETEAERVRHFPEVTPLTNSYPGVQTRPESMPSTTGQAATWQMRHLNPGQLKVQSQMASRRQAQRIPYLLSGKN